ncbi:uncharacterized protein LOC126215207 [Schistocerca nitens]|uniref:uncharacterized protein LOC126215207 n=1 Tax=Schistocerca nitens TaxID=7011 RepID=UPI002118511A|nr:uncharacterized protein LOC126215207 [Schistocerca nitens]
MRFLAEALLCLAALSAVFAVPARVWKPEKDLHVARPQLRHADSRLSIEFNELFDRLIDGISTFIVSSGLDPLPLPDEGIESTITDPLGIERTTEISLKKGWLTDLSTFQRDGDAKVRYVNSSLHVFSVGLDFPTVSVAYDYTLKILDIGPTGSINAKAEDLLVSLEVNIDVATSQLSLGSYTITDAGKLTVQLQGGTLVDWIANGVINLFTWLFQDVLLGVVEDRVRPVLAQRLSQLTVQDVLEAAGVAQGF